jgi:hypothetical protein
MKLDHFCVNGKNVVLELNLLILLLNAHGHLNGSQWASFDVKSPCLCLKLSLVNGYVIMEL